MLRGWDFRWSADVGSDVAGRLLGRGRRAPPRRRDRARRASSADDYIADRRRAAAAVEALAAASDRLTADFGTWKTPWGDINRFQRLTGDIVQPFDDAAPSIPVGFTSSRWGSLASFGARTYKGTKKMYGTTGNSFVAVVEFGDRVRARAVTAGGESGDPAVAALQRPGQRYATGDLREVYFYRDQLKGHIERQYSPGK